MQDHYLYLYSLSISLIVWLTGFILIKRSRKLILISSILSTPAAFFTFILVPEYWNPTFAFGPTIRIEDFIFCFFSGGIISIIIRIISRYDLDLNIDINKIAVNSIILFGFGTVSTTLFYLLNTKFLNPFITMLVTTILALIFLRSRQRIIWSSMVIYLIYYIVLFNVVVLIWPGIKLFWTAPGGWSRSILNIPLIELIWAVLYSGSWTSAMIFVLDLKPVVKSKLDR